MAAITYKCPNCGGGLVFDPGTQKYKCEYCLSLFDQQELEDTGPDREDPGQWTEGNADLWKQFPAFVPAAEPRL